MDDTGERLILVVDDEPRMIRFIRMNLELEGYRVVEATNGLEALDRVRKDLPDLVVMDVQMPEMDGFEALGHIRRVSTVPVSFLAGSRPFCAGWKCRRPPPRLSRGLTIVSQ